MPSVETGLWVILAIMGSVFTFVSLKTVDKASMAFHLIAVALWMGLSVFAAAGYEVSSSTTNFTYDASGALLFNQTQTDVFIPAGTTASWLSFLFLGFAIFNIMLVFKQIVRL